MSAGSVFGRIGVGSRSVADDSRTGAGDAYRAARHVHAAGEEEGEGDADIEEYISVGVVTFVIKSPTFV